MFSECVRCPADFIALSCCSLLFTRPADATPPVVFTTTDTQTLLELVLTQLRLPNCVHHPGELYLASEQIFMMDGTPVPSLVTPSQVKLVCHCHSPPLCVSHFACPLLQLCWCVLPSKLVLRATYRELLVVRRVLGNLVADARAERGRALASQSKLQESLAKTKQRLSAVLADLVRPSLPSTPCTPPTSYLFPPTPGGDGTRGPKWHHTV